VTTIEDLRSHSVIEVLTEHRRIVLIILLMLMLYGAVIFELIADWCKNGDDAHGFFVFALSLYLIYRKRDVLCSLPCEPSFAGFWMLLASLGLLVLGSLGAEFFLTRISLLSAIVGLMVYVRGWKVVHALRFTLLFSLLMVPLPGIVYYQLVFPLQLLASRLAIVGLELLNLFPVIREGNLLFLPHYTLEVVEACSGVRSLMSLLALALGFGYILRTSNLSRVVLSVLVVPLSILSNALRLVVQALIVTYWGLDIGSGPWHQAAGLLTFMSAALLLLVADKVLVSLQQRRGTTFRTMSVVNSNPTVLS
jgi:exosortase